MPTRKPDYRVGALNKETDVKGNVGAAWNNPDGSIAVIIDPFIVLNGGKQLLVTLWPNKENPDAR